MNVLVATALSQGNRDGDYHWCIEGELVTIEAPCACDRIDPEKGCGCSRGFAGLNSHRATTTARIANISNFTFDDYVTAIGSGLLAQGWDPSDARDTAQAQLDLIEGWPEGAIVERCFNVIGIRCLTAELTRTGNETRPGPA